MSMQSYVDHQLLCTVSSSFANWVLASCARLSFFLGIIALSFSDALMSCKVLAVDCKPDELFDIGSNSHPDSEVAMHILWLLWDFLFEVTALSFNSTELLPLEIGLSSVSCEITYTGKLAVETSLTSNSQHFPRWLWASLSSLSRAETSSLLITITWVTWQLTTLQLQQTSQKYWRQKLNLHQHSAATAQLACKTYHMK